ELVLPNNYVVLEQEEMMYLDGGFSIPRWPVATAINIAFNGVLGGGAISLVRNYIRNYGLRRVTSAIAGAAARYVGVRVANRVAGFALSAINGFAAWMSIGDAITTIWANNDVNRRDPNLNALW
ncbi:SPH_0224 family bacteriocin-like peptide, partial [Streptococcus pneumoniae]